MSVPTPSGGGYLAARLPDKRSVRLAAERLSGSNYPAVVIDMPTDEIVVASAPATALLAPGAKQVLGRRFADFTSDSAPGTRELFRAGHVNGLEAQRTLSRPDGDVGVYLWMNRFDSQPQTEHALIMMSQVPRRSARQADDDAVPRSALVGACDAQLSVTQLSGAPSTLAGATTTTAVGRPLGDLVGAANRSGVLNAVHEAATRGCAVSLYLQLSEQGADATGSYELLVLPTRPAPSCAFALLPAQARLPRAMVSLDLAGVLRRLARDFAGVESSGGRWSRAGAWEYLSPREIDVVSQLLDGDRVPAIATKLQLSQSTVRSHVAAAAHKLGVRDQQGLVDFFRAGAP